MCFPSNIISASSNHCKIVFFFSWPQTGIQSSCVKQPLLSVSFTLCLNKTLFQDSSQSFSFWLAVTTGRSAWLFLCCGLCKCVLWSLSLDFHLHIVTPLLLGISISCVYAHGYLWHFRTTELLRWEFLNNTIRFWLWSLCGGSDCSCMSALFIVKCEAIVKDRADDLDLFSRRTGN